VVSVVMDVSVVVVLVVSVVSEISVVVVVVVVGCVVVLISVVVVVVGCVVVYVVVYVLVTHMVETTQVYVGLGHAASGAPSCLGTPAADAQIVVGLGDTVVYVVVAVVK
jgi:hypothetical protein